MFVPQLIAKIIWDDRIQPDKKYPWGGISDRTIGVRYNFVQKDLWKKEYNGFLSFSRNLCGKDFFSGINNGKLQYLNT